MSPNPIPDKSPNPIPDKSPNALPIFAKSPIFLLKSNISLIPLIVSSNFFFNFSSSMASNKCDVSLNISVLSIFPITENKINCKYFHITSLVFCDISSSHNLFISKPGKNLVFLSSSPNISSFSYNISKKRSG